MRDVSHRDPLRWADDQRSSQSNCVASAHCIPRPGSKRQLNRASRRGQAICSNGAQFGRRSPSRREARHAKSHRPRPSWPSSPRLDDRRLVATCVALRRKAPRLAEVRFVDGSVVRMSIPARRAFSGGRHQVRQAHVRSRPTTSARSRWADIRPEGPWRRRSTRA